jgi:dipeptidyl-peptidase 4
MRVRSAILVAMFVTVPIGAQQQLTAADYTRAAQFLRANISPLIYRANVRPVWLPDGRFWYRVATPGDTEIVLVDPKAATKTRCDNRPDHCGIDLSHGPSAEQEGIRFGGGRPVGSGPPETFSPDGKWGAFVRDWNLWVKEVSTGREMQLTQDGVRDFGYATDNAGWRHSDAAVLLWSPDSKKIATYQQDQRRVPDAYLVSTKVGHPVLSEWKYSFAGDSIVPLIQRVIIDLAGASPKMIRLQMPPDERRTALCDDIACPGADMADVQWYPDGSHLAFLSLPRDRLRVTLRVADATTGVVRDVLEETVQTEFEDGVTFGGQNWRVLPASNEVIWCSQRDDWAQLYLYDLTTGRPKQQITHGEGNVRDLVRVDERTRTIYFDGIGKEPGRDPYFIHFYKVGFDGKGLALLTPGVANHQISLSPSGAYFIDRYSTPVTPPVTVLRSAMGKLVLGLEQADISRLAAIGWKPPTPITVKARDGKTDLYGLMFVPAQLDSARKYPIVDYVYPGPQSGSVGSRAFNASSGADLQALAELGFVVVQIDGMGTELRSKSFQNVSYGHMGDATIPDQVAGIRELGQRYRWIDLDRVGIYGHSGGGYATANAMFHFPDFFKVGVSESGNHDQRDYEDAWGEVYQGMLHGDNYDSAANENFAGNLKGKLLLAHGALDDNVPPDNTYMVVDALIKANKDFDLLILPNQRHGYGSQTNYMMRRRWDYFVKNLLGAEPPKEYEIRTPTPGMPR